MPVMVDHLIARNKAVTKPGRRNVQMGEEFSAPFMRAEESFLTGESLYGKLQQVDPMLDEASMA